MSEANKINRSIKLTENDSQNKKNYYELTSEDFEPAFNFLSEEQTINKSIGFWEDVSRRLKKSRRAGFACIVLALIILVCLTGPILTGKDGITSNLKMKNISPGLQFWFGTDELGRDIFTRICLGGRTSLFIAIIGALIDMGIGLIYGGISGYAGGRTDIFMMRIVEILSSIPYLIVCVLVSLIFGKGIFSIIMAMTITGWCFTARLVRGQILQIKNQDFVLAARALGTSPFKIIIKHLLPNTISVMIIALSFNIPSFIFGEAFLSYIGLGIQPPHTSWGVLAAEAQKTMLFYPYQLFFPALFISLTILSLQIGGDAVRDAMDPHLRRNK